MSKWYLGSIKASAVVTLLLALSCIAVIFTYSPYIHDSAVTLAKFENLIVMMESKEIQLDRDTTINYFRARHHAAVDDLNSHRSARFIFIIFGIVLLVTSVIQLFMIARLNNQTAKPG